MNAASKIYCFLVVLIVAEILPASAYAGWTAKAQAGLVAARGNTRSDTANVKFDIADELMNWKHAIGFTGIYTSDALGTTAQRWEAHEQSDYKFSDSRTFWFGAGRYEDDRFSGFRYQAALSTGVGRHLIETDATKFLVQIGAGYKVSATHDTLAADGITLIPGEITREIVGQGRIDYEHVLTTTTKIVNKFLVEAGANNTLLQNEFLVQVKIVNSLALAAGYSVHYNTEPPPGFKTTDTLTTINLVYELK